MGLKRGATSDTLTGGTKDVSPQLLTMVNVMTVANTYKEVQVPLPVNRFFAGKSKAIVIEILKLFFDLSEVDANPPAPGGIISIQGQLSTVSLTGINAGDSRVFVKAEKIVRGAFTAAGSYATGATDPITIDLTDGAGHGFLVAGDQIFFGLGTSGFTGPGSGVIKALYRFKEIGLDEYIGIVQGQQ